MDNKQLSLRIFFIIMSIGAIVFMTYNGFYRIDLPPNESLSQEIRSLIGEEDVIDFRNIKSFEWDRMVIVRPYSDIKKIMKRERIDYIKINTSIETHDDINLIIFVKNNKIVQYVNLERTIEFKLNRSRSCSQDDAIFHIEIGNRSN